jgi:hypothetical protein
VHLIVGVMIDDSFHRVVRPGNFWMRMELSQQRVVIDECELEIHDRELGGRERKLVDVHQAGFRDLSEGEGELIFRTKVDQGRRGKDEGDGSFVGEFRVEGGISDGGG